MVGANRNSPNLHSPHLKFLRFVAKNYVGGKSKIIISSVQYVFIRGYFLSSLIAQKQNEILRVRSTKRFEAISRPFCFLITSSYFPVGPRSTSRRRFNNVPSLARKKFYYGWMVRAEGH